MAQYLFEGILEDKAPAGDKIFINISRANNIRSAIMDLKNKNIYPSELGLDFLILSYLVYYADISVNREWHSQDAWTRQFKIVVPVSDVDLWNKTATTLKNMLNFLTGDFWEVEFKHRDTKQPLLSKQTEMLEPSFSGVSLFSGGLDSFVGAIDHIEQKEDINLFVSYAGEATVSSGQGLLFDKIRDYYKKQGTEIDRLRFPAFAHPQEENSTRGRSFLFFGIAIFAASGIPKCREIVVPENGLMSLNIPLDPTRLGASSTRTTHPFYMHRWNELVKLIGLDFIVKNPYWNKTKGEMLKECSNQKLVLELLNESISCAHPSAGRWTGELKQCGVCVPCIIRHAAIVIAFGQDTTEYIHQIEGATMNATQSQGEQIRGFQYAIKRLKDNKNLSKAIIHTTGPLLGDSAKLAEYVSLYERGIAEVENVIKETKTTGRY